MHPLRPYADPIDEVPGRLCVTARLATMGVVLGGLQFALVLAAAAFHGWGVAQATGLGVVSVLQGLFLLATARHVVSLGREESELVPRATRHLVASGGCLVASGLLVLAGLALGSVGVGAAGFVGFLFGLETSLLGLWQVRSLDPGRPGVLGAKLAARVHDLPPTDLDSDVQLLQWTTVTANPAGLHASVIVGGRPGTLQVDLSRLPIVAELRLPLPFLSPRLRVVDARVAPPDSQALGDPILDGMVAVQGPPAARNRALQDHGALLSVLRGWPGSSIEGGALVLRIAQPEAERTGLWSRLRGVDHSNTLDLEHLLEALQQASPEALALAKVLDSGPKGEALPGQPGVSADVGCALLDGSG